MANPYKKAEQVKKVPPKAKVEEVEEVVIPAVDPEPVETVEENTALIDKLLEGKIKKSPKGAACNVYLNDVLVQAIDKQAKQRKISRSQMIRTILESVLLDK